MADTRTEARRVGWLLGAMVVVATVTTALVSPAAAAAPGPRVRSTAAVAQPWDWQPPASLVGAAPRWAGIIDETSTSGQVLTYGFADLDTDFRIQEFDRALQINLTGNTSWYLSLVFPAGHAPETGVQTFDDVSTPRDNATAYLTVGGDGRGCGSSATGWFAIDDLVHASGQLTSLSLRFEYRCGGERWPPIRGALVWSAAPAPAVPEPIRPPDPSFWRPPASFVPAPGPHAYFSVRNNLVDPPVVSTFGPGEIAVQPEDRAGIHLTMRSAASSETADVSVGPSSRDTVLRGGERDLTEPGQSGNSILGGFSFIRGGTGCGDARTPLQLVIDQVAMVDGAVDDLDLRFIERCYGTLPRYGVVHWESPVAAGAPGVPTDVFARTAPDAAFVGWTRPIPGASSIVRHDVLVYRDGDLVATRSADGTASGLRITGLQEGGRYSFKVRAVNGSGPGYRSAAVAAITGPAQPLIAPHATLGAWLRQTLLDFRVADRSAELATVSAKLADLLMDTPDVAGRWNDLPAWRADRAPLVRLYAAYFQRLPDTAGFDSWVTRLQGTWSLSQVSATFARSGEFQRRYGSLDDAQFVDRAYRNVFGRPADAGGLAFWTARLARGTTRGSFMVQLSESSEHVRRTAPTVQIALLYRGLLQRLVRPAEVGPAQALLAGDRGAAHLAEQLLRSSGYAARFS